MTTIIDPASSGLIRVKVIGKMASRIMRRQLPDNNTVWGNCIFDFDPNAKRYDWLVVYDDLPPVQGERFSLRIETLACPRAHTLLVTSEPASVKIYGNAYTSQFGHVLTSQPAQTLPHPNRIYSQAGLLWFYGFGKTHELRYDTLAAMRPQKTKTISTVCSDKTQKHTLHHRRYHFTQVLKAKLPELDVFGHGVRDMDDKAIALDDYRYHIAIENYSGRHHWTEKLSDAFLGFTLPFYYGCSNLEDYFPPESFIEIDIFDVEKSYRIISNAIRSNQYEKRLPYILEARRKVLEEYNLFALLATQIESRHRPIKQGERGSLLYSRRAIRKRRPLTGIKEALNKNLIKLKFLCAEKLSGKRRTPTARNNQRQ